MANKLVLELLADANPLLKGLEQAQRSLNQFVQAAGGAGTAIGGPLNQSLSAFTSLAKGGGAAAGVLAGAFVSAASAASAMAISASNQAEELTMLSAKLGVGTDTLQEYDVLLNRVSLTGEDLSVMFKTLSTNLEQAQQGTGTAGDRFRQLGINIKTVTDSNDLIRKIAQSTSTMADGTAKAAIFADLFGKAGLKFIPAFEGGAAAIDAAAKASERLGATMSTGQLAILNKLNDAVDDMSLAWTRFGQQLGAIVAPAITWVIEKLTTLLGMVSHALKLTDSSGTGNAPDTRAAPPKLIDTAKISALAQTLADAQLKASEGLFKNQSVLAAARLDEFKASLDAQKALSLANDLDVTRAYGEAQNRQAQFQQDSITVQLANYEQFTKSKMALFTADDKGTAERKKFEVESTAKRLELQTQLEAAVLKTNTTIVQSSTATAVAVRAMQIQPLQDEIDKYSALDQAQQALYASERSFMGASDAARRVRFALIDAEADKDRLVIEQSIIGEERKAQKFIDLDTMVDAKRRQTIQAFPSVFESQMQAIVSSNVFSMGSMVSTWTGGIAQMAVHGGNLKAVWEQTQVAMVQASLNAGVQQLANFGLWISQRFGMEAAAGVALEATKGKQYAVDLAAHEAFETGKTGITAAEEVARGVMVTAAHKLYMASAAGSLASMTVLGEAAIGIADGIVIMIAGVFAAIGAGLAASIVGAPLAPAFEAAAGSVIVAGTLATVLGGAAVTAASIVATAAIAGLAALPFSSGGIGNFGSGTPATLHGKEAVIPLNSRGAAFMQDVMGGGGGMMTLVMQMDGREVAKRTLQYVPGIVFMKTGLA